MKLRPEQRKLWRKTYHQERDRDTNPTTAAERADEAVSAWEERGAFDEEDTSTSAHSRDVEGVVIPGNMAEAFAEIRERRLEQDIAVAYATVPNAFTLIAWTERGRSLVRIALTKGYAAMMRSALATPPLYPMSPVTP